MNDDNKEPLWNLLGLKFRAHPWHGVDIGDEAPEVVTTYIEIVPQDTLKYELDKVSGLLRVDRPQSFSNVCPALYGLVPQTLCAEKVADLCQQRTGKNRIVGDGDPLDICVLSERVFPRGDILLKSIPIGGMRMIDENEADDKIISVLEGDAAYSKWKDIDDVPDSVIERLRHYFLTYKGTPEQDGKPKCEITHIYGRDESHEVIQRAQEDYLSRFEGVENLLNAALWG